MPVHLNLLIAFTPLSNHIFWDRTRPPTHMKAVAALPYVTNASLLSADKVQSLISFPPRKTTPHPAHPPMIPSTILYIQAAPCLEPPPARPLPYVQESILVT